VAPPTSRRRIFGPLGFAGTVGGVLFLWQSFFPTLMPRSWVIQGVVSGICAALGYLIGATIGALVRWLLGVFRVEPPDRYRRYGWILLAVGAAVVGIIAVVFWPRWQNDQRDLLDMEHLSPLLSVGVLVVAAVVAALLVILGRLVARGAAAVNRFNHRHLPHELAGPVTVVLILVVTLVVFQDVLARTFTSWANSAFGLTDTGTDDGITQPSSPLRSGSPESLAEWDTLGRQGRTFVATATTPEELRAFAGDAPVTDPIRVYVGLRTADTTEERAALAVAELQRTGAFEREVLAVVTVTGTGWIDPDAAEALEVLHRGDTAMVAVQYSFLPSWISFLTDKEKASDTGAQLFNAVHAEWARLPVESRPKLVVFGLSLGSFGAEAPFAGLKLESSLANMLSRTDGVLLAGPTNDNPVWRQAVAGRNAGTPVWRPELDGGRIRFANNVDQVVPLDPSWSAPRILYYQHPSDPVTFVGPADFVRPSDWTQQPRGPDVPEGAPWFPIVTGVQGVFDLMAGFGAPPGHGHDYRLAYGGAWAQVVPPDGWTATDTERLNTFLNEG
jgi:uncharacterized membrane protein